MAETLFAGRCVDGDIALCEATLSTQCFLKLVELGVPFPRNRYGEYIGYKTGNVRALWQHAAEEISRCGAAIRDPAQIRAYGKQVEAQLADFAQTVKAGSRTELAMLYRLRDMLLSQRAYLTAMTDYTAHGGKSRGSALYTDLTGGTKPFGQLPDTFTFAFDETEAPLIQELWFEDGTCRTAWRAPRPIPEDDDFFENFWRSYRETGNID